MAAGIAGGGTRATKCSQAKEEVEQIRYAIQRSRPYGSERWVLKAVAQFGLENTLRNPGRPKNGTGTREKIAP